MCYVSEACANWSFFNCSIQSQTLWFLNNWCHKIAWHFVVLAFFACETMSQEMTATEWEKQKCCAEMCARHSGQGRCDACEARRAAKKMLRFRMHAQLRCVRWFALAVLCSTSTCIKVLATDSTQIFFALARFLWHALQWWQTGNHHSSHRLKRIFQVCLRTHL